METGPDQNVRITHYHQSAVNSVTRPERLTHTSHYFLDRWMPRLGPTATAIVLALRRSGFLDRRTGEERDELAMSSQKLALAAGISVATLFREMGNDEKTGKPRNPALHQFVQKRRRSHRDHTGQLRQEESVYWVSMDDPVHPDDWPLVAKAALEREKRDAKTPDSQFASPVGCSERFAAQLDSQRQSPDSQFASRLKTDSSRLLKTPHTPQWGGVWDAESVPRTDAEAPPLSPLSQPFPVSPSPATLPVPERAEDQNVAGDDFELTPPGPPAARPPVARSPRSVPFDPVGFGAFWQAHPRKVDKQKALAAWQRLKPGAATQAAILAGVENLMLVPDWDREGRRFVALPSTFLNGHRWEDELLPAPSPGAPVAPVKLYDPANDPKYRRPAPGSGHVPGGGHVPRT